MRALLSWAVASAAFVTLAPSGAALAGADDGNPVIGRAIFVRDNCYSCHGTFGGGGMGPNLRDGQPNNDAVRDAVLNGKPAGMPSFRGLLNDNDVAHLIEYLDTLESNDEPVSTHWWEVIPSHFPGQVRCCAPPNEPPHSTP